ncbi:MAG: hypothetical protein IJ667_09665, partial [Synergistaceae bacterium]|nr:hypothetical protein [Synergistaceae bacterium]
AVKDNNVDMFKYAEKCLYEYKRNLAALEILRQELQSERNSTDVHGQNYKDALSFTGTPSNPVLNRLVRIEKLEERIRQLEHYTEPVTRLIADLKAPYVREGSQKAELHSIMELYYFGQNSVAIILSELHISRQSMFRHRRTLVKTLMGYMGCV